MNNLRKIIEKMEKEIHEFEYEAYEYNRYVQKIKKEKNNAGVRDWALITGKRVDGFKTRTPANLKDER